MRHIATVALLVLTFAAISCDSESPIAQNDLTFTDFKTPPDSSTDYLAPVSPNPFNRVIGDSVLDIRFSLHDSGSAIVLVQNVIGDVITQSSDSSRAAGRYTAHWNPLAHNGTRLKSGLYFITLHTKNYINSRLVNIQENE